MRNKSILNRDYALLLLLFVVFILIRSVNFNHFFSFVYDQANFSTSALEIFRDRKVQLIGPSISINLGGREIFQGGIIYYFFLIFLLLGHFDPKLSTYLFIFFSGLMIVPLYYGIKLMHSKNDAIFMSILYAIFPIYIHGTMSLWNPHFQFALTPILLYLMGIYKVTKRRAIFFALSFFAGFLLQFHYQYIVVILGLFIYYFLIKKLGIRNIPIFILGLALGFSPMILFELRNKFYNLNTILLFLSHYKDVFGKGNPIGANVHYFLSISLFLFMAIGSILRNQLNKIKLICIFVVLLTWSTLLYVIFPSENSVVKDWSYDDELKVYNIIKNSTITNYNISSFYNATATTQKYFLKRDEIRINFDDYRSNKYLYVIYYKDVDFKTNRAYEMNTFNPSIVIKKWQINEKYDLILSQRI